MEHAAEEVHNGYFSMDKKKIGGKNVEVFKDTKGTTKADDDTYSLIMRDKERLLSLATPLKFIFSHSALREGWDNPNVFQICTLREMAHRAAASPDRSGAACVCASIRTASACADSR
jgi:type III restriction enzyme